MNGFFDRLREMFGGGGPARQAEVPAGEPEIYKDYVISSEPIAEGGQFRLAGRIRSQATGKEHHFVRADIFTNRQDADAAALLKARRLVDEQGEAMFG